MPPAGRLKELVADPFRAADWARRCLRGVLPSECPAGEDGPLRRITPVATRFRSCLAAHKIGISCPRDTRAVALPGAPGLRAPPRPTARASWTP